MGFVYLLMLHNYYYNRYCEKQLKNFLVRFEVMGMILTGVAVTVLQEVDRSQNIGEICQ